MKKSAGILLYRRKALMLEFFLVHPGGPYWKNKDLGAWSIPKGEFLDDEDPLKAALRELEEETGISCPGPFIELIPIKQKSGKVIYCWAAHKDTAADKIKSNHFELEWPPESGKLVSFPEVDRAEWFSYDHAERKILPSQLALIDELIAKLNMPENST